MNELASLVGRFPVKHAVIDESTAAENVIVPAVSNKSIRVISESIVVAGAVSITWRTNTTNLTGPIPLAANGGMTRSSPTGLRWTQIGEDLRLNSSAVVQVSGELTYIEADFDDPN